MEHKRKGNGRKGRTGGPVWIHIAEWTLISWIGFCIVLLMEMVVEKWCFVARKTTRVKNRHVFRVCV